MERAPLQTGQMRRQPDRRLKDRSNCGTALCDRRIGRKAVVVVLSGMGKRVCLNDVAPCT